jgi:hypothetical protein
MAASARQHAHDLLDRMPSPQLAAVSRLLEVMLDPIAAALAAAPVDDEPVSAAEARDAAWGRKWLAAHRGIPFAEIVAEIKSGPPGSARARRRPRRS